MKKIKDRDIIFETNTFEKIKITEITKTPKKYLEKFFYKSLINQIKTGELFTEGERGNIFFLNETGTNYILEKDNPLIERKPKINKFLGETIITKKLNPRRIQHFMNELFEESTENNRKNKENFIDKIILDKENNTYTAILTKKGEEYIISQTGSYNNLEQKIYQKNTEIREGIETITLTDGKKQKYKKINKKRLEEKKSKLTEKGKYNLENKTETIIKEKKRNTITTPKQQKYEPTDKEIIEALIETKLEYLEIKKVNEYKNKNKKTNLKIQLDKEEQEYKKTLNPEREPTKKEIKKLAITLDIKEQENIIEQIRDEMYLEKIKSIPLENYKF